MPLALGQHSVVELYDCDPLLLASVENVQGVLVRAAKQCKATIVQVVFHEFNPYGVSGMVIIAESHLAIHTWPEFRYAAVDIFTCGERLMPSRAAAYIAQQFESAWWQVYKLPRGRFDHEKQPIRTEMPFVLEDQSEYEDIEAVRPKNLLPFGKRESKYAKL